MSISPRNLWPEDIAVSEVVAPVSILKDQASLLGERTKNLVEGRVTQRERFRKPDFVYDFYIVAPALNNYRYRLFSISHDVEFYPLAIDESGVFDADGRDFEVQASNEEEFLEALATIFSSERTKGIISSLIAQSRA